MGEEIVCGRSFFKFNFAIRDSKINENCKISLCDAIGSKKPCRILFLRLNPTSGFYLRLTPNSFLKELIFERKASRKFLKFPKK